MVFEHAMAIHNCIETIAKKKKNRRFRINEEITKKKRKEKSLLLSNHWFKMTKIVDCGLNNITNTVTFMILENKQKQKLYKIQLFTILVNDSLTFCVLKSIPKYVSLFTGIILFE